MTNIFDEIAPSLADSIVAAKDNHYAEYPKEMF